MPRRPQQDQAGKQQDARAQDTVQPRQAESQAERHDQGSRQGRPKRRFK